MWKSIRRIKNFSLLSSDSRLFDGSKVCGVFIQNLIFVPNFMFISLILMLKWLIREEALDASGRTRITENYVQAVRAANCRKKIGVYVDCSGEAEIADFDELDLSL